ncbi:MAG: hypothetical protein GXP49_13225 [Deltaproteobacteria bacterium]|nr:hypothetical protein [Deltaproteobacteria bacterium]
MHCPHCGTDYDDSEPVCPQCGRSPYIPKHLREKAGRDGKKSSHAAGREIVEKPKILITSKPGPPASPQALKDLVKDADVETVAKVEISDKVAGQWEKIPSSDPAWAEEAEDDAKTETAEAVKAGDQAEQQEDTLPRVSPPLETLEQETADSEIEIRKIEVHAAGFWKRLLAMLVDAPILLLLAAAISLLFYLLPGLHSFPPAREHGIDFIVDLALRKPVLLFPPLAGMLLSLVIYRGVLKEKTFGRRLFSLKVIRISDGEEPSTMLSVARSVLLFIGSVALGICPVWAGFDKERKALHDHLCGTMVIVKSSR